MKLLIFLLFITASFISCNNEAAFKKAEDAQDAGREFIRASLDGNYEKARFYLLNDSTHTNVRLLEKWKSDYNRRSVEDKVNYKDASIVALKVEPLNDSTVNFVYTNTFEPKDTTTIKIVRDKGEWLVDLKDIH
ncbi:MAG: hypothetical protein ABIN89_28820 [Chitinophagaceae bacterium]